MSLSQRCMDTIIIEHCHAVDSITTILLAQTLTQPKLNYYKQKTLLCMYYNVHHIYIYQDNYILF